MRTADRIPRTTARFQLFDARVEREKRSIEEMVETAQWLESPDSSVSTEVPPSKDYVYMVLARDDLGLGMDLSDDAASETTTTIHGRWLRLTTGAASKVCL